MNRATVRARETISRMSPAVTLVSILLLVAGSFSEGARADVRPPMPPSHPS